MVYAGIGPDSRVLVRSGRKAAERYFLQYREPMPTAQMVKELATLMQEYTQQGFALCVSFSCLYCILHFLVV